MRLLICGDLHLTEKKPANRIDNYEETVLGKFEWILKTAQEEVCDEILQPGDFFDQPNPSYGFFSRIIDFIEDNLVEYCEAGIYSIFGQHDLRYRSKEDTAFLALTKVTSMFRNTDYITNMRPKVVLQGCSWEEEIPEPVKGKFNILIIHKMIVDEKLWAEQEHFEYGNSFLKDHKFDLIVSGDNHKSFHCHYKGRYLFNCGSMMRSTIGQIEHKPHVVIFDTENPSAFEIIPFPIAPASEVFNFEEIVAKEERNEKLDTFVNGLSDHKEMGLSFEDNLTMYIKKNGIDNDIYELIKRGMNG